MSEGAAFCPGCGQPAGTLHTARRAAVGPNAPVAAAPVYPDVPYAGFWLRFVAYLIDSFILGACFALILVPIVIWTGVGSALGKIHPGEDAGDIDALFGLLGVTFILAFFGIIVGGSWLYNALLESSAWQGSVGKKMLSLKVTDLWGRPITFARASGRHFGKIITSLIPFGVGYILAGFTEKKQAIHDMLASCLVLRQG